MNNTGSNRRKLARLTMTMEGVLRHRAWWRFSKPQVVEIVDFNRYGAGFVSHKPLAPGSKVLLDLKADHFVLRQVEAQVVSVRLVSGKQYRIGVRFYTHLDKFIGPNSLSLSTLMSLEESFSGVAHEF